MKRISRVLRRILGLKQKQTPPYEFSYTISWMKVAREWSSTERAHIRAAVERVGSAPGFSQTQAQRCYAVQELDQREVAGESLVARLKVLDSLDQQHTTEE
jgi:hypothetical protein